MKYVIYLIGICLITLSCKKDKLEGDMSILIGKWNLTHTDHLYGICDGDSFSETLTPESEGHTLSMEFFEKGIIKFYQNDKLIGSDRLVIVEFGDSCSGAISDYISFNFRLNNKNDRYAEFRGCVSPSQIEVIRGFPNDIYEVGCEFFLSNFVKE